MGLACRALLAALLLGLLCQHIAVPQATDPANDVVNQGIQQGAVADVEASRVSYKFRGREWHPESFGYTNCSTPASIIKPSGNIFDCRILRDVCVDQGVIIYQDSRFHPWTSDTRLPYFNITDILWNTPSVLGIGDKWKIGKNRYQFPLMRPWHHMEESDDVRRPLFSNCTTPLLFFHHFPFNVAEVYRFAVNNLYFLQQRLRFFDDHITLVPGSPPMSAVPSFTRFWLQPFSRYAITSLGMLSQRWSPGTPPPPSAATGEGVAVRCFSRFVMCKLTLKKPTGAFFEAGQFVANYYAEKAKHLEANFTQRLAAEVPLDEQLDDTVMKVVFAVRSKSHKDIGRVLWNEDDLIARCNALKQLNLPPTTQPSDILFRRVHCFRHIFGVDNLYDMWVVRRADVLVGVHGSALTNAMFMRRGSSLIEFRPFGFSGRESWPNIYMKSQTRGMEVFWYGIDVMNASLSSPGAFESDMQPMYTRAKGCVARDRNLEVPWEALLHQLLNAAVVSRNLWRYKVLRYSHAYYITHDIKPLELHGKDRRVPQVLQSWFTDADEERRRSAAIPLTPEGIRAAQEAEEALLAKEAAVAEAERQAAGKAAAGAASDAEGDAEMPQDQHEEDNKQEGNEGREDAQEGRTDDRLHRRQQQLQRLRMRRQRHRQGGGGGSRRAVEREGTLREEAV